MAEKREETNKIPTVNIDTFTFSPPGPMGWSSIEYEQLLDNPEHFFQANEGTNSSSEQQNQLVVELPSLPENRQPISELGTNMTPEEHLTPQSEENPSTTGESDETEMTVDIPSNDNIPPPTEQTATTEDAHTTQDDDTSIETDLLADELSEGDDPVEHLDSLTELDEPAHLEVEDDNSQTEHVESISSSLSTTSMDDIEIGIDIDLSNSNPNMLSNTQAVNKRQYTVDIGQGLVLEVEVEAYIREK
ncbi:hypothetical protein [Bacillus solimangrovi]|uniref:Uncharacterized protein n=1 Tax=Bacillus solimangrovi TaxID=1305675 RepID=A0A1E5LG64_9BACI|nr:hypothetical protein [Bacillus solimangrovi]OEH93046.1 hypothetical protein BFG57_13910 [Bacillus solimangrovi]